MGGREFVVNQLSPKITQGIAPTLIMIRTRFCMQSGQICSEAPSSMHFTIPSLPTSSTQVRIKPEPGRQLPANMPMSEIKSKPSSEDLGLASSSMESVSSHCQQSLGYLAPR